MPRSTSWTRQPKKFGFTLEYDKQLLGGCAIDAYGDPFPEVTEKAAHAADAVMLGAVGGPKWDHVDPSIRPEKACCASVNPWVCTATCVP